MTASNTHSATHEGDISQRADDLFRENQSDIFRRTDKLFAGLMILQWIVGIAAAVWISPLTWAGAYSETHLHVWSAIILGGVIALFPVCLALTRPGSTLTRHAIAISQMLTSALLIHLSGGRVETHFHIFGSLAFLACYRDWRVLISATIVVATDHFARGIFYPQSVFGVLTASPWRVFEHAAWVVFEDIFLVITIKQSVKEMKAIARHRAVLEKSNEIVEAEVDSRTKELEQQAYELMESKQKSEELSAFGDILDRSLNEIYIFDTVTLHFVHVNYGAKENIGYTMEELRGMTPLDIKPEHTHASFTKMVAPLLDEINENIEFTTVHRRKDGSEYPVHVHLEVSVLGEQKVFAAIILDITERQKMEKELRDSREKALSANQSKSEFLANMSHEIRTPMTAILGFTDLLLDNVVEPENVEAVRTVKDNGNYLINLINDILDLSKIEAGKIEMEQIDCSAHAIVADVTSLMRVRAIAKGLPLEVRFDGPIPEKIQSDPTRLRQILINLVGNAIKFTETGSVQITTRLLNKTGQQPKLQFDIIDTGIGIADADIAKLFMAFTQADSSTTRQFGGTGLGLTISKRLVEALGGEISVSSTIGKGSTFSITVSTGPLDDVRMAHNAVETSVEHLEVKVTDQTESPLNNYRILLAEDGPDNQRLIGFILRKAGAEVTLADNGHIGLELATVAESEGCPFDVILMDMQMPVLDGYAATKQLREKGYVRPIIALTAHAMATDRQKCLDAGCDSYATKPIDRKELISLVARYASQPTFHNANTTTAT